MTTAFSAFRFLAARTVPVGAVGALRRMLQRRAPTLARAVTDFHLQPDRELLERIILPHLAGATDTDRVLFVGCDWYTKPYRRLFKNRSLWTLDVDPSKRCFGASAHVTDRLCNLRNHVPAGFFDAIVCNGVFMKTAIETYDEAEQSFLACFECLREGGWFVLGWNDTEELRPYPPSESAALARFSPEPFPNLGVAEILTPTEYRHTYNFFRRPQSGQAARAGA